MKKVSLIIRENKKDETLKKLRKLGIVHIEIAEGAGERLASLQEQIALLESAIFTIGKRKNVEQKEVSTAEALSVATRNQTIDAEKKQCVAERVALSYEHDRLNS
jgi:vacuolar-type H+-ATPase subunit I/STV1